MSSIKKCSTHAVHYFETEHSLPFHTPIHPLYTVIYFYRCVRLLQEASGCSPSYFFFRILVLATKKNENLQKKKSCSKSKKKKSCIFSGGDSAETRQQWMDSHSRQRPRLLHLRHRRSNSDINRNAVNFLLLQIVQLPSHQTLTH